jgi:hypothetical protein
MTKDFLPEFPVKFLVLLVGLLKEDKNIWLFKYLAMKYQPRKVYIDSANVLMVHSRIKKIKRAVK